MNFINRLGKGKTITIIAVIIVLLIGLIFLLINKREGIYYRTYSKKSGWTSWVKNGKTCGKKGEPITAIQIKVQSKTKGNIFYDAYINGKWVESDSKDGDTLKKSKKEFKGIYVALTGDLYKKYNVYYRTRNKENDWLSWAYNGNISGNAEQSMDQIKIILKSKNELFEPSVNGAATYLNF